MKLFCWQKTFRDSVLGQVHYIQRTTTISELFCYISYYNPSWQAANDVQTAGIWLRGNEAETA
jgi:hypothetical protein